VDANTKLASITPDAFVTPAVNVAESFHFVQGMQRIRLQLTNFVVTVTSALGYAGAALCTLPNDNLLIVGSELHLTLLKGGLATGIVAATNLNVGVGSATAGAIALATTAVNIMPLQLSNVVALTDSINKHSLATTPVFTGILKGLTNQIFLNVGAVGGITVGDTVTFNGSVDIFLFNLKNVAG
jgi:hypothetical protein